MNIIMKSNDEDEYDDDDDDDDDDIMRTITMTMILLFYFERVHKFTSWAHYIITKRALILDHRFNCS